MPDKKNPPTDLFNTPAPDEPVLPQQPAEPDEKIITLNGMYQGYFLDYASYVILERAVPAIEDGLKPVQRRILHALKEMDDGRYNKIANVIGQTMQYHPHGDAAIGDALVNLGQKDLLIDCQGNWGNIVTGASAAAARYIEGRLTKFALDVAFKDETTTWQVSYDGRKREPVNLPMKFPLLLAQGTEGIAVGLSTKILPHNFIELIQASIAILHGRTTNILPDFPIGGWMDASNYNGGKRGGKIRIRAKIDILDKETLIIREIPYGTNTETLKESIESAIEKGKIKIKKIVDLTGKNVEIMLQLPAGVSPEVTMDALYPFTDCEISISPNCCVIIGDKPHFIDVNEMLRVSTQNTKQLLRRELEIHQQELEEKWHFACLERVFIENRIYHKIEECESWEAVLQVIEAQMRKYVRNASEKPRREEKRIALMRDMTEEDYTHLTEIRIKRISKYNKFKADELIGGLEKDIETTKNYLAHLTEYAVAYFEDLLKKYGKGRERRTQIMTFDTIQAAQVIANNAKLYVNRIDGFVGMGMKKDELVCDCSDIDEIIVFRRDGKMVVTKISDKTFVGKDIIHIAVWKKGDDRTTYNIAYLDGKDGTSYAKRFHVKAITRDKEYDLTQGNPKSKILYLTANPNGESELISVKLTAGSAAKVKIFEYDFAELGIKGRDAQGNILTKYPVKDIAQKEVGKSTIGAQQVYWDNITGRLNTDARGTLLGAFDTGDCIFVLYKDGTYEMTDSELTNRYATEEMLHIQKLTPEMIVSAVYFEGNKGWTMVKRFRVETTKLKERISFISDHKDSRIMFATVAPNARIKYTMKLNGKKMQGEVSLGDFMEPKGWKAIGNRLSEQKLMGVEEITVSALVKPTKQAKVGDTIEFDM